MENLPLLEQRVPSQLCQLQKNFNFPSSLQVLNLGKNALKEIPRAIFQLEQLTKLDLSNNFIIDIPPGIEQMKELIHLNLKLSYPLKKY